MPSTLPIGEQMAERDFRQRRRDLELDVGHGVAVELRDLVSVSDTFAKLIDEVASELTGIKNPIRWIVEIEPGSVRLPLWAEVAADSVRLGAVEQIGEIVSGGLGQLETSAVRPDYFTDRALDLAYKISSAVSDELPVAVRNGHAPVKITPQLAVNVEKVLGVPRESIGTIEGRLEALNVHGKSRDFSIWPMGDKVVKCFFGTRLDLDKDILPAVSKRVAAHGKIKTRPSGERVSLIVDDLRIIGDAPASADEVRGILSGYERSEW